MCFAKNAIFIFRPTGYVKIMMQQKLLQSLSV